MKRISIIGIIILIITLLASTVTVIPVIGAGDNFVKIQKGFTIDSSQPGQRLEKGSIIHHFANGVTEVYGANKSLKFKTKESENDIIITPHGPQKANRVYNVPSGSQIDHQGNITKIYSSNDCVLTIIDDKQKQDIKTPATSADPWIECAATDNINLTMFDALWNVPTSPPNSNAIDFYFTGIQPADGSIIIQPVLQWNNIISGWSLSSWDYWNGGSVQSTPISVATGDPIHGNMTYSNGLWVISTWKEGSASSGTSIMANLTSQNIAAFCTLECGLGTGTNGAVNGDGDMPGGSYFTRMTFLNGSTVVTPTWHEGVGDKTSLTAADYEVKFSPTDSSQVELLTHQMSANTLSATSIGTTSATINGKLDRPTTGSITVDFQWGATTSYGNVASSTLNADRTFNANLSGLSTSTTYHYRSRATNAGITYYGPDQSFTTGTGISAAPLVTTTYSYNPTSNSVTLYGTLGDKGTASSASLAFDYGLTSSYGTTVTATPSSLSNAGVFSYNLTGLNANTAYHFRAKATGNGTTYGADQTFSTRPATNAPPIVSSAGVSNISKNSATIYGILSSPGSTTPVSLSFEYGLTSSYGTTVTATPSSLSDPGTYHYDLTGLSEKTTYHYRAKAIGYSTAYGSDQTFTTIDPPATFGLDSGNGTWNFSSSELLLQKFQNTAGNGTLTHLELNVNNVLYPPTSCKMAIYNDDGSGHPGTLLCDAGTVSNIQNGWVTSADLSSQNKQVVSGNYYWLGFVLSSNSTVTLYNGYGTNTGAYYGSWSYNNSWPANFSGTNFSYYSNVAVMRATIQSSGGSDTTPPSAITNLATGSPTSNSINLTWTAPGDDGNTGTASQYDIRYSTSTINNDATWNSATQVTGEPTPQVAGTNQSFTVTGLSPSTTYYFALKTADEVPNWSGLSNCPSGTTSSGGTVTFGLNSGNDSFNMSSVEMALQRFQNTGGSGTLKKLEIYMVNVPWTTNCKMAIYNDDGSGHPGTLLCDAGTVSNIGSGWVSSQDLTSQNKQVTSGSYYWLGFNLNSASDVSIYWDYGTNTCAYTSNWNPSYSWPASLSGTSFSYYNCAFVMRATVQQ